MAWTQVTDPLHQIGLSALVAVVPIVFIFWALIIRKMKGHQATLSATGIAILVAILVYRMPAGLALLSAAHGALYGLFPICWIIIGAIFLFNITVHSGQFEVIKHFMAGISSDRRLQALLIAFSFGAFLEGTAGFGAPVAITAAMLIGLGFHPLYAAGLCLIANTAPVAFGSIGIPITVASQVSGLPELAVSQMVGRTLPLLSLILPLYLVVLMSGWRRSLEVWPAILVSGLIFALVQWFSSNYLGPMLPDVVAGMLSVIGLMVLLRFWKPSRIWRFREEAAPAEGPGPVYTAGQVLRAWSPFLILTLIVLAWGLKPVKAALDGAGLLSFDIPGLQGMIRYADGSGVLPQHFKFNYLSASGTAILLAGIVSMPLLGVSWRQGLRIFAATLNQLKYPIVTIAAVLAFAYVVNNAGISLTLAAAMASTGVLFPFFAPVLGWLGVFITGSDTSSNALFARLQHAMASSIGVDPVVTVGANCSGGVMGKMISPQSIAVAAAAVSLVGRESDLFRFTVKHSFFLLGIVCAVTCLQAYVLRGLIPVYGAVQDTAPGAAGMGGALYLGVLALAILLIAGLVRRLNRKPAPPPRPQA